MLSPRSHSQWSAMRVKSLVYSSSLSRPTVAPVLYPPVPSPVQLFPPGAHRPSMHILPSPRTRCTPARLPSTSPASRPFRRTAALRPLRPFRPDVPMRPRCQSATRRHGVGPPCVATVVAPPCRRRPLPYAASVTVPHVTRSCERPPGSPIAGTAKLFGSPDSTTSRRWLRRQRWGEACHAAEGWPESPTSRLPQPRQCSADGLGGATTLEADRQSSVRHRPSAVPGHVASVGSAEVVGTAGHP